MALNSLLLWFSVKEWPIVLVVIFSLKFGHAGQLNLRALLGGLIPFDLVAENAAKMIEANHEAVGHVTSRYIAGSRRHEMMPTVEVFQDQFERAVVEHQSRIHFEEHAAHWNQLCQLLALGSRCFRHPGVIPQVKGCDCSVFLTMSTQGVEKLLRVDFWNALPGAIA